MISEPDTAKINYVARRPHKVCEAGELGKMRSLPRIHDWFAAKAGKSPNWVFILKPTKKRDINWWLHKLFAHFLEGASALPLSDGRTALITWQVS